MRGVQAWSAAGLVALGSAVPALAATAQAQAGGVIYTCTNAAGKKLTSDRRIPECNDREQRVLNSDGSLREVIAATMTADERTAADARARAADIERARQRDAVRADMSLVNRFPNEAAHNKARAAALDAVTSGLKASDLRLAKLARERKPLDDEAEFYIGKPLPLLLKSQIDANDAAVDAQRALVQNQKDEGIRINEVYDVQLERLRRLWAGAQAGSMGPMADAASAPSAKKR
ncbi:MAG TPA: hypothetical protein VGM74_11125 [Burkholderiaceae bacterium]